MDKNKNLIESELQNKDLGRIFSTAEQVRSNSFLKKNIASSDLMQLWKDEKYPTDSRDIVSLLHKAGFSNREINKVFKEAGYGSAENPAVSPAMEKLAAYIIDNGYTEDIVKFMRNNYDVDNLYVGEGKVVFEDLRKIFDSIVKEDRPGLDEYIRRDEKQRLGRNKK